MLKITLPGGIQIESDDPNEIMQVAKEYGARGVSTRRCKVCGGALGYKKSSYCSKACTLEGGRRANQRHREKKQADAERTQKLPEASAEKVN